MRKKNDIQPPAPAPQPSDKWLIRFSEDVYAVLGKRSVVVSGFTLSDGLLSLEFDGTKYLFPSSSIIFIKRV